jgi:hypothetical protein
VNLSFGREMEIAWVKRGSRFPDRLWDKNSRELTSSGEVKAPETATT